MLYKGILNENRGKVVQEIFINRVHNIDLYEELDPDKIYFIGVKCERGLGMDNTAVTILDPYSLKPVGEFKSQGLYVNTIKEIIIHLVKKYIPKSIVIVERNDQGITLLDSLFESKIRENIYFEEPGEKLRSYGIPTDLKETSSIFLNLFTYKYTHHREDFIGNNIINDVEILMDSDIITYDSLLNSSSLFSYLMTLFVYYHGKNLARYGFVKEESLKDKPSLKNDYEKRAVNFLEIENKFSKGSFQAVLLDPAELFFSGEVSSRFNEDPDDFNCEFMQKSRCMQPSDQMRDYLYHVNYELASILIVFYNKFLKLYELPEFIPISENDKSVNRSFHFMVETCGQVRSVVVDMDRTTPLVFLIMFIIAGAERNETKFRKETNHLLNFPDEFLGNLFSYLWEYEHKDELISKFYKFAKSVLDAISNSGGHLYNYQFVNLLGKFRSELHKQDGSIVETQEETATDVEKNLEIINYFKSIAEYQKWNENSPTGFLYLNFCYFDPKNQKVEFFMDKWRNCSFIDLESNEPETLFGFCCYLYLFYNNRIKNPFRKFSGLLIGTTVSLTDIGERVLSYSSSDDIIWNQLLTIHRENRKSGEFDLSKLPDVNELLKGL